MGILAPFFSTLLEAINGNGSQIELGDRGRFHMDRHRVGFCQTGNRRNRAGFWMQRKLSDWKKKRQHQAHAAFAKGKAFTITGMMGCGYSWGYKTQAQADAVAMKFCRQKARNPDQCYISDRTKTKK